MIFAVGSVSQSVDVLIVDDSGLPVTGLDHTTFPDVFFSKAGPNADVQIMLVALATLNTPHSPGGVKERGEGRYRLDLPDTVYTVGAQVTLRGEETGKRLICPPIEVSALLSLLEADLYIDDSVTPWAVVHMVKGSGGIGVGTELMRKRLASVDGTDLISTNTVVGQAHV